MAFVVLPLTIPLANSGRAILYLSKEDVSCGMAAVQLVTLRAELITV
jgi:hypothetical protein